MLCVRFAAWRTDEGITSMGNRANSQQAKRAGRLEQLEARYLMTAMPAGGFLGGAITHHALDDQTPMLEEHQEQTPDFWITDDAALDESLDGYLRGIESALANAHDQTGLTTVRNTYGFLGGGQTVAVIDSGIAYDHYALGSGFGTGSRVVGGWDFTGEYDADPYDDGPSGSHGTHVSGIVGADSGSNTGVAPEVDLVGLRVFDDSGAGFFSWVENALDWVHTNQYSFENPITTVNLSLGVSGWNSDTLPTWAMLEDEFAQLEADGIFIAVSAGNSFTSYDDVGLSYPAASTHVVPVMSADDSGLLSYYSQRHSRAIAAPGRGIVSTVPDYAGDNNGQTDDYRSFSGTSMASPYVAGASVIIREAMEFVGYTGITQDTIYDHMIATADTFFDAATNQSYNRLNLESAFTALMPADDYGSSVAEAYDLGTIGGGVVGSSMSSTLGESSAATVDDGVISTLSDADYFSFTAGLTGTVSFTASNTHDLVASWDTGGGSVSGANGEILTLDVVSGQTYAVGIATSAGLGYYDLAIDAESSFTFTDWGDVTQSVLYDQSATGETWFRIEASQDGFLTAEAFFEDAAGVIDLDLFDTNLEQIAIGTGTGDWDRVDTYATAGEEYFVRVTGTNASIDFRLTNLVSLTGTSSAIVAGTAGDDSFGFVAGTPHVVTVNSVMYDLNATDTVTFLGGIGADTIIMTGTSGNETATLRNGISVLDGNGFIATATNAEFVSVNGSGGQDVANFFDSAGNDIFTATPTSAELVGDGFEYHADGFNQVYAYATAGGTDRADLYDSAGDDRFISRASTNEATMSGDGFIGNVQGFDQTVAHATAGGTDRADFYDSSGDDRYIARAVTEEASMTGSGYTNTAISFERNSAYASLGGTDRADFYDSSGDDRFAARAAMDDAFMAGDGYYNYAHGFERNSAYSTSGGTDQADFYDSSGDDRFAARVALDDAYMSGSGYYNYARGFSQNSAYATAGGGSDRADFYDSTGDDRFIARAVTSEAFMSGGGYESYAKGFGQNIAYASAGGIDRADFYDSAGDDRYIARAVTNEASMSGNGYSNSAEGFERNSAYATSGGTDRADFYDGVGDDRYAARAAMDDAYMSGDGYYNYARGFERNSAYASSGGMDRADFYDSTGDDRFAARIALDDAYMTGTGYLNYARGFGQNSAYATAGGGIDRADFYDSVGDDLYVVQAIANEATMSGGGYTSFARGFDLNTAYATEGGADQTDFYDSSGDDNLYVRDLAITMTTIGAQYAANGFEPADLYSQNGGVDVADIDVTDYIFNLIGDWN
jgi:subtilisin family serine protease